MAGEGVPQLIPRLSAFFNLPRKLHLLISSGRPSFSGLFCVARGERLRRKTGVNALAREIARKSVGFTQTPEFVEPLS
jgi:hypothetical protein